MDARVPDEGVQPAELAEREVDGPLVRRGIGDVTDDLEPPAGRTLGRLLGPSGVTVEGDDMVAAPQQLLPEGPADAGGTAGEEHDLAGELFPSVRRRPTGNLRSIRRRRPTFSNTVTAMWMRCSTSLATVVKELGRMAPAGMRSGPVNLNGVDLNLLVALTPCSQNATSPGPPSACRSASRP